MSRKITILILVLVNTVYISNAQTQEFAPIGAIWWYSQDEIMPPYNVAYWRFEVRADTIVDDIPLRTVRYDKIAATYQYGGIFLLKVDSEIISIYNPELHVLAPYFDFGALPGDTIITTEGLSFDGSALSVVDSVTTVTIAGQDLKRLYLRDAGTTGYYFTNAFESNVTERIGPNSFFFPQFGAADPPSGGPLRCYEDNVIGLYGATDSAECDYLSPVETIVQNQLHIFPNPAKDFIYITGLNSIPDSWKIFDLMGKEYYPKMQQETGGIYRMAISDLLAGIYCISIYRENVLIGSEKIMKW